MSGRHNTGNGGRHGADFTDKDRHSFLAIIKTHKELLSRPDYAVSRLGENEVKILIKTLSNKHITIARLSEELGISTTAVENNISKLKAKNILKHSGADYGGYWELSKIAIKTIRENGLDR